MKYGSGRQTGEAVEEKLIMEARFRMLMSWSRVEKSNRWWFMKLETWCLFLSVMLSVTSCSPVTTWRVEGSLSASTSLKVQWAAVST